MDEVKSQIAQLDIAPGTVITGAMFDSDAAISETVSNALRDGMVATTVSVDQVHAVAGLVATLAPIGTIIMKALAGWQLVAALGIAALVVNDCAHLSALWPEVEALTGRDPKLPATLAGPVRRVRAVLRSAGAAEVHVKGFDADDLSSHTPLLDEIHTEYGPIGTAVLAFGLLGDQARAEEDVDHAVAIVHTDYVAQVSLLTLLAQRMRAAGRFAAELLDRIEHALLHRGAYRRILI